MRQTATLVALMLLLVLGPGCMGIQENNEGATDAAGPTTTKPPEPQTLMDKKEFVFQLDKSPGSSTFSADKPWKQMTFDVSLKPTQTCYALQADQGKGPSITFFNKNKTVEIPFPASSVASPTCVQGNNNTIGATTRTIPLDRGLWNATVTGKGTGVSAIATVKVA